MKTISNKKIYINKESIIFCGDYLSHPSIEGAVSSGIEAANQLLE
jgi:predicted NAD/FAD-dependent oxidoreductase